VKGTPLRRLTVALLTVAAAGIALAAPASADCFTPNNKYFPTLQVCVGPDLPPLD
jgi:hypothetical protein